MGVRFIDSLSNGDRKLLLRAFEMIQAQQRLGREFTIRDAAIECCVANGSSDEEAEAQADALLGEIEGGGGPNLSRFMA
jgi:hypothetical protein